MRYKWWEMGQHIIPLSPTAHRKRLVWQYSNNGIYVVRSDYRLAMEMKEQEHSGVGSIIGRVNYTSCGGC